MAAQAARTPWIERDARHTTVLFAWLALAVSILIYFSDWSPPQQSGSGKSDAGIPIAAGAMEPSRAEAIYTGSIILVPWRGDDCWQRLIDNRTGQMWDVGFVNCQKATSHRDDDQQTSPGNTRRIRAIAKAFQQTGN